MKVRTLAAALKILSSVAVFFAAITALDAAWIPLKAELAQQLLQHSWNEQKNGKLVKPWPWADTHAIARLEVPRLHVQQIVLEGSSGRNLAFGPVIPGSALEQVDWIINGHRDTHFRFLQQLQAGDEIRLETANGLQGFAVTTTEIIDSRLVDLVLEPGIRRLSLVTCYPFDAAAAGGPLRYVVTALPLDPRASNTLIPPAVSSG